MAFAIGFLGIILSSPAVFPGLFGQLPGLAEPASERFRRRSRGSSADSQEAPPPLAAAGHDLSFYRRTGIINAYEDPTFRNAFESLVTKTARRHVIISDMTIGTCCAFPTLSMLQDGYKVFPVIDACGGWNHYETEAARLRMTRAGADCVTAFALACELQADWKLPTANDMLAPFNHNLSEYGFVLQNFWNNANQHAVPDPFEMVK